jgi:polyhydroxyalkanoate synthesis repressor PhaR
VAESDAAPRLIRRYANRKLYDVRTSAYVALEDLAALVRAGETVQVVDMGTGEDITAQTLTQVILDEGRRGPSVLPAELLHTALRRGGRALDAGRDAVEAVGEAVGGAVGQLRHGVDDLLHQSIGRLTRVLPGARADELDALRRQLAEVERTLAALVARHDASGAAPHPNDAPPAGGASPSPSDDPRSHA